MIKENNQNRFKKQIQTVGIGRGEIEYIYIWICHDILLYKLEYNGFRGVALDWFKSYLSNRKQCVRYQIRDSDHKIISCDEPQGFILKPLLFILYINGM